MSLEARLLNRIRRWWRPITCVGIAATMVVHGIILPMWMLIYRNEMPTDLMGLAALVTATAGAFAVREWGKIKGADNAD